ncbi:MAG: hypothetical protein AAB657_01410 [Patescibacteria group bacterium]
MDSRLPPSLKATEGQAAGMTTIFGMIFLFPLLKRRLPSSAGKRGGRALVFTS